MKKILLFLTTLMFLIPLNLRASDITAKLTGPKEVEIGQTLTVTYTINVPNIGETATNVRAIFLIGFEVDYSEELLSLRNVKVNNYENVFLKSDEGSAIISAPKNYDCFEGIGYCASGNYTATLTFDILSKETKPASIKIIDPIVQVLDAQEIVADSLKGLSDEEVEKRTLKESPNNFETLIVTLKKPKEKDTRSTNTNLKLLEVQNYNINFNKDVKEYEINVAKEVNKIVVKAETEDSKSRIIMTGDDDLSSNGNKVTIEVVAEDDSRTTYTINVIHKEDLTISTETPKDKPKSKITSDKKILKLFGIIGGVLALIILIFIIIGIIRKRKINKMFEEL